MGVTWWKLALCVTPPQVALREVLERHANPALKLGARRSGRHFLRALQYLRNAGLVAPDHAWYLLDRLLTGPVVRDMTRDPQLEMLSRRMRAIARAHGGTGEEPVPSAPVPAAYSAQLGPWDQRVTEIKQALLLSMGEQELVACMIRQPADFAARMATAERALLGVAAGRC